MATQRELSCLSLCVSRDGIQLCSKTLRLLFVLSIWLGIVSTASAQTPSQQYVYAPVPLTFTSSDIRGFSKVSQTGALTRIPGSPFNERLEGGAVAIDGQGKFLFVLNPNSNNISMFQIDQTSGALTEVRGSPFAVPPTLNPNQAPTNPISIATEKSGKFVFVGYYLGDVQGLSSVVSLAIDTSGPNPVLVTQQSTPIFSGGNPVELLTDPKGLRLYVGLRFGQNGLQIGGAEVYSIDSSTGALGYLGLADAPPGDGRSDAIDVQGRFFFAGWGRNIGFIDSNILSPVDGTSRTPSASLQLGFGIFPVAMFAENSGKFLYVAEAAGAVVYSIDQLSGALTQILGPFQNISLSAAAVADPQGPYIYSVLGNSIAVYQVDQQSGNLTEIPGSPFNDGSTVVGAVLGIAISGNTVQAVSGPAATIFPSTAIFRATAGTSSATGVFSIVNIGDQTLSINSISISGPNASDFSETNTCASTLAPNANCSVSINFVPAGVGPFSATLQVADNAPGSPQTLALSGTGVAPVPAITFSPTVPSFPIITEGTTGATQTLTVISTGTSSLHVSSVSLAGPNPLDFSFINNCTAPVAPGANCTISLVFNPIAPGQRTVDLMITDDVKGSPQTISLSATAIPAFTPGPAPNGSTTASVSPGQTAQYLLQLTPGAGYSGTVSLACSGAPLGAKCQVPASVSIASGAPAPFTVNVSTSGGAMLPPSIPWRFVPPAGIRVLLLLTFTLLLVITTSKRWMFDGPLRARRLAWSGAVTAILFCSVVYAAGCGSSSVTITPPPIVTPPGTSTITITMSAMSPTQQPLQLQPLPLTLTVK
jgi:centrosomal CEP192-like protein/lactonase family protein with 7-bladed beta-propeller